MFSANQRLSRRDMLKLSAAGVLGTSVSGWFDQLAARAAETAAEGVKHKSCILLWMGGGPSQHHTFDVKEGGDYKPIGTSVPGITISEHLPKLAQQMQHMAILKSMSTGNADHGGASYLMHTGFRQGSGGTVHPSIGAVAGKELGPPDFELPYYVSLGSAGFFGRAYGAGYLGPRYAPVVITDPAKGLENLKPTTSMQDLDDRASLVGRFDRQLHGKYENEAGPIEAHVKGYDKAVQLMHSSKAKALDLNEEPASVRAAYGIGVEPPMPSDPRAAAFSRAYRGSTFPQGVLLARRLVEAGVPFVEVGLQGWDTHGQPATQIKPLSGYLDPAMAALISDLKERGLLDSTLVIWMGEFGRSPAGASPNPRVQLGYGGAGTNHYARCWTTVLAGAGLKTGQIIGKTDAKGGTVEERPIGVADFMATVCKALGIDHAKRLRGANGRPFPIVDKEAKVIEELFS